MTAQLGIVDPDADAKSATVIPLHDQLRELTASILSDTQRVVIGVDDPVGGGPACTVTDCPRSRSDHSDMCDLHLYRWDIAGKPPRVDWDPGPAPGPQSVDLSMFPLPLRWEIAYGIDQARRHPNPPWLRLVGLC